jgi:hypothetical protein
MMNAKAPSRQEKPGSWRLGALAFIRLISAHAAKRSAPPMQSARSPESFLRF